MPIGTWDTSSVKSMAYMFAVRVLPSRLLLTRCRVVIAARPLASRSPLTPPENPSLAVP